MATVSSRLTKPLYPYGRPIRRAPSTPESRWLKNLICPFLYGRTFDGVPKPTSGKGKHAVTNEILNDRLKKSLYKIQVPNYRLSDHWKELDTLYFCGNPHGLSSLVLIDIDVDKKGHVGSTREAWNIAKRIKKVWPNVHVEISTHGKGIHGYFVVIGKERDRRTAIHHLDLHLKALFAQEIKDGKIEQIEVKGQAPEIDGDLTYMSGFKVVKFGTLAKIPRDMTDFETWQQIPTEEILALPITPKLVVHREGSCSGKVITQEYLDCLPKYRHLAQQMMGAARNKVGRWNIIREDFAIAFMLLAFVHKHPATRNDGTMPQERIKKLWMACYQAGDIDRSFCDLRWKEIRNYLSQLGLIQWTDNVYTPKECSPDGKGVACKWDITEEFFAWINPVTILESSNKEKASLTYTEIDSGGEIINPVPIWLEMDVRKDYWAWQIAEVDRIIAA